MQKDGKKKLVLNVKSLRTLTPKELANVTGGATAAASATDINAPSEGTSSRTCKSSCGIA